MGFDKLTYKNVEVITVSGERINLITNGIRNYDESYTKIAEDVYEIVTIFGKVKGMLEDFGYDGFEIKVTKYVSILLAISGNWEGVKVLENIAYYKICDSIFVNLRYSDMLKELPSYIIETIDDAL